MMESQVPVGVAEAWWVMALRGVITLAFGIAAFFWPVITLAILIVLYGLYMFGDGIFAVVAGVINRAWAMLLVGVLGIVAGLVTFFWPQITAVALLYVIGITAIVRGVFEIATAISWRRALRHQWLLIIGGVVSIIFGAIVVAYPLAGAIAAIYFIATYAVVLGVVFLALAIQLRRKPAAAPRMPPSAA